MKIVTIWQNEIAYINLNYVVSIALDLTNDNNNYIIELVNGKHFAVTESEADRILGALKWK